MGKLKRIPGLWRVVKIMRVSKRRKELERNLTKEEAQRVVKSYPNSQRSMVVMYQQ